MLKIKCTHIQQQSICQVFKARNVCFSFYVLYSPSYVWSLTVVYPNNLQWGGLATLSYLLPIANDQSWKDYRWKHWELTPWWSVWNVSILRDSNKYMVTCLSENNIFSLFYDLVTVKVFWLLNLLWVAVLIVFLRSLTLLIWSKSLCYVH